MFTHYDVLNIEHNATPHRIKKAYHETQLKNHPDKTRHLSAPLRALGERVSKAANNAYEVLSDPSARRDYDLKLRARPTVPPHQQKRASPPAEPAFQSPLWYSKYQPSPSEPQTFTSAWFARWYTNWETPIPEESRSSPEKPTREPNMHSRNKHTSRGSGKPKGPNVGTQDWFTEWPSVGETVGGRRRG
jgi:curved DNA-binding protein CbpA